MPIRFSLLCFLLLGTSAMAADAPQPDSTVQPVKRFAPRSVTAPTISETRATRMPDGSLALTCLDRPNPKVAAQLRKAAAPAIDPDQRP